MKNLISSITLFSVIVTVTLADEIIVESVSGRYDIAMSMEGVYFLDTSTGELWLKGPNTNWKRVDSPVYEAPGTTDPDRSPITLDLPESGVTMPMIQRESRDIPGSKNSLKVQLGDITGGQVFVEVVDDGENVIVQRTSLRNKEFLKFQVNGTDVYLQIHDMVNNLVGEDLCKVFISHQKPKSEVD